MKLDPTNNNVLYTAALIAQLKGNRDAAVGWLQRAVSSGYPLKDLQRDPEFKSIQNDPSFPKTAAKRS